MEKKETSFYLSLIAQAIFDKKGVNILCLDVRGISSLTDYLVIADGNVDKHVTAIANAILNTLKSQGIKPIYVEGIQNGDWIVLDFLDIMVHLFMPGWRDTYRLEELFRDAKIVDVQIDIQPKHILDSQSSS